MHRAEGKEADVNGQVVRPEALLRANLSVPARKEGHS